MRFLTVLAASLSLNEPGVRGSIASSGERTPADGGCLRLFEPTMQSCQVGALKLLQAAKIRSGLGVTGVQVKRDVEPLWNRLVALAASETSGGVGCPVCMRDLNAVVGLDIEVIFWSTQEVPHEVLSSFKALALKASVISVSVERSMDPSRAGSAGGECVVYLRPREFAERGVLPAPLQPAEAEASMNRMQERCCAASRRLLSAAGFVPLASGA